MGELEDKINSLLSSPDEMGRIVELAKSFMTEDKGVGSADTTEADTGGAASDIMGAVSKLFGGSQSNNEEKQDIGFDPEVMKTVSRLMGGISGKNDKTALVSAMAPYMSDERGKRLGKAVQMAKLLKMAKVVFSEYGGGDDD